MLELNHRGTDLELLVQRFDVVLDALYELRLVLADGAADVRPHEQRVEPREDAEHLVRVLGRAQLVAQVRRDARLHAVCTHTRVLLTTVHSGHGLVALL